jgi:hypothetical protein
MWDSIVCLGVYGLTAFVLLDVALAILVIARAADLTSFIPRLTWRTRGGAPAKRDEAPPSPDQVRYVGAGTGQRRTRPRRVTIKP